MKRSPMKPRTTRLKAKGCRRFPKGADPEYLDWIRTRPCLLWYGELGRMGCRGVVVAHHVRSKGAGGTDREVVNLCDAHHREGHDHGWMTFERKYQVDLPAIAAALSQRYDQEAR